MDVGALRHYVARAMEFLLILSAMLSAVTGAFAGARGPEAQIHRAEASVAAEIALPVVEQAAQRTAPAGLAVVPVAAEPLASPHFALPAQAAPETDRLIE